MSKIELIEISKTFKDGKKTFKVEDINLTIPEGKTMVILGPSGCGKTTLLRMIAGLDLPDQGQILFDGLNMAGHKPVDRKIGMVFQNYALIPHWTSKKNMMMGYLFKKKTDMVNTEMKDKLLKTSEILGMDIEYLMDRNTEKLSGGEKQKIALGRCVTRDPSVFLMDEPLSSLDAKVRETCRIQLKRLLKLFSTTSVYVTHDQREALMLADLITIMDKGKIVQTGTTEEIYNSPVNQFAADFLNLDTYVKSINFMEGGIYSSTYSGYTIGVRPTDVRLEPVGELKCRILKIESIPYNKMQTVLLSLSGIEIFALVSAGGPWTSGEEVFVRFERFYLFNSAGIREKTVS